MSQTRIAKAWKRGIPKDRSGSIFLNDGTITVRCSSFSPYADYYVVVAYTDEDGLRTVYNYTSKCLATEYLYAQSPYTYKAYTNRTGPFYPSLTYAELGEGLEKQHESISAQLIRKLIEEGEAHRIVLPVKDPLHPHYHTQGV
jgi:hypothetical protein